MSLSKNDFGFIMMESLVSLSILALFIGVVFPFGMELLIIREQAKKDVELNRFLYESALFYDMNKPENRYVQSGDISAHSIETERSIHIYVGEEPVSGADYLSAEWD